MTNPELVFVSKRCAHCGNAFLNCQAKIVDPKLCRRSENCRSHLVRQKILSAIFQIKMTEIPRADSDEAPLLGEHHPGTSRELLDLELESQEELPTSRCSTGGKRWIHAWFTSVLLLSSKVIHTYRRTDPTIECDFDMTLLGCFICV